MNNKTEEKYVLPSIELLYKGKLETGYSEAILTFKKLEEVLESFKINVKYRDYIVGPLVTRYNIELESGTTIQLLNEKSKDIALAMETAAIRVVPIPEEMVVGIEIPNTEAGHVNLREFIDSEEFKNSKSLLTWAVGTKIGGSACILNLAKMPHLLIAGSDDFEIKGCIDNIILSILYKAKPNEVKFMLIDTKRAELMVYRQIPHLYDPCCAAKDVDVITKPNEAINSLKKLLEVMEERYEKYASSMVRNIEEYNIKMVSEGKDKDYYIVCIINELLDLMTVAPKETEDSIQSLAQKARAVGIHLVLATQSPTAKVITDTIKENFPSRLAFRLNSIEESNIILDCAEAKNLLSCGDMLFLPTSEPRPIRLQCAYVSSVEVEKVVTFITKKILLISQYDKIFEDEKLREVFTDKISDKLIDVISEKTNKKFEEYHKAIENTNNAINFSKQVSNKLFNNYNLIKKEKGEKILKELIETVSNIAANGMFFLKTMEKLNKDLTNIDTTNKDKLDLVFILDDIRKEMEKVDSLNKGNDYEKLKQIDKEIDELIEKNKKIEQNEEENK